MVTWQASMLAEAGGLILAFALAWAFSLGMTRFLISYLSTHAIIARENDRTLHKGEIPVGGGWAIVLPVSVALFLFPLSDLYFANNAVSLTVAFGFLLLAVVSWADDRRNLPRSLRFILQILAVTFVIVAMPNQERVFSQYWPLWVDRLIVALCWLWFINLFNFMDGMDGMAGMETLFIVFGLLIIELFLGQHPSRLVLLAIIIGAVTGFLWYNKPPAKIFLGDVGAIPLGFLLGWLLIQLSLQGYLTAAFILPGYFLADASLTLIRRLIQGEMIWNPHRSHFYQKAALALNSHARVLWRIIPGNFILLILALFSLYWPFAAAIGSVITVGLMLFTLWRAASVRS